MLKPVKSKTPRPSAGSFAVVASRYNDRYVKGMLNAAVAELKRARVTNLRVVRVPGAYEIPIAARQLAGDCSPRLDAVICLGVVLRGETSHAAHIGEAVSRALMDIQLAYGIPVIHEVLLLENEQ